MVWADGWASESRVVERCVQTQQPIDGPFSHDPTVGFHEEKYFLLVTTHPLTFYLAFYLTSCILQYLAYYLTFSLTFNLTHIYILTFYPAFYLAIYLTL
jgi:hypothetical protein